MGAWDGDYSRDMFPSSRRKQYTRGRMQQGKEVADADRNDNTDLQYEKLRNFIQKIGGDAFFFGDGFKITADGSSNDFQVEPGSGFLSGHEAYLGLSARYVNLGVSQEDVNLHSVSSVITDTVLTDRAAQWAVNELVGRQLFPNLQDGTSFTILSNTATEITVASGLLAIAEAGDSYYIGTTTPSGSDRTDTVWLNLYLDEISADEDNYLFHNLGSGIELDRRIKARTIIEIEQGASTYADYVDLDGNQHYRVKLATIFRYDGVAAINPIDVADDRILTTSAGGSLTVSANDTVGGYLDDKIGVTTPLAKQILNPGGDETLQLSLSSPGDANQYLRGTNPPTWGTVVGGGGSGGSGAALEGKTFAPVQGPRGLGTVFVHPGPGGAAGSQQGTADLSTAGGVRVVPSNATHVILTGTIIDCNVSVGNISLNFQISPGDVPLPNGGYALAYVNAGAGGEGSLADTGQIIIPIDPTNPIINWRLDETLGGTYTFLSALINIEGWYVTDSGSAPTPVAFSARKADQQITVSGAYQDVVNYDTTEYNEANGFDPVTGQFIAPTDGKYRLSASVGWDDAINQPQSLEVAIWVDGAVIARDLMVNATAESDPSCFISVVHEMTAGQVAKMQIRATYTGTFPSIIGEVNNFFQGELVASVGSSALEGTTFVPASGAEKVQHDESFAFNSSPQSRNIDFSVVGTGGNVITPPAKATHALVRVKLDVDGTGTLDDAGNMRLYVGPYTATPASLAVTENQCCLVSLNETSEGNATDSAPIVVELNDPVDPTADLTVHLVWDGTPPVDLQVGVTIWIEGWYIEQSVATILSGTFALEGTTFLPLDRGEDVILTPLSVDGTTLTLPNTPSTVVESGIINIAAANLLGSISSTTGFGVALPPNATHVLLSLSYAAYTTATGGGETTDILWMLDNVDGQSVLRRAVQMPSGRTAEGDPIYAVEINQTLPNLQWSLQTGPSHNANGALAQLGINLLGFYITDTGTEPDVPNGAILATVAGGAAGSTVVDIIDFTWPEATSHLRITGSAAFTAGGNGDLSHVITLAAGADGQITGQAVAEALDFGLSEKIIYNNVDVVAGLELFDQNPASAGGKEIRIRIWDTGNRRIVIEHDVGASSESGVLIEAVG